MLIRLTVFLLLLPLHTTVFSQEMNFAVSQYDNQEGKKFLVINGFKKAECQKLISTFFSGLKIDCPQCTKDFGSCTKNINEYATIWENKKYIIPYFSSGNLRIIPSGFARIEIVSWCNELVKRYEMQGRKAICIN